MIEEQIREYTVETCKKLEKILTSLYEGKKLTLENTYIKTSQYQDVTPTPLKSYPTSVVHPVPVIQIVGKNTREQFTLECVANESLDTYLPEEFNGSVDEISVVGYKLVAIEGDTPHKNQKKLDYIYWDRASNEFYAHIENTMTAVPFSISIADIDNIGTELEENSGEINVELFFFKVEDSTDSKESLFCTGRSKTSFPNNNFWTVDEIVHYIQANWITYVGYNICLVIEGHKETILINESSRTYRTSELLKQQNQK